MSGRKISALWSHFDEFGSQKAKCKYCSSVLSISGGSVNNLKRHLKAKHPFAQIDPQRQPAEVTSAPGKELVAAEEVPQVSRAVLPNAQPAITEFCHRPPPIKKVEKIDKQVCLLINAYFTKLKEKQSEPTPLLLFLNLLHGLSFV